MTDSFVVQWNVEINRTTLSIAINIFHEELLLRLK